VPCSCIMPLDTDLVQRAATFAREAHAGHFRKDAARQPYFVHLDSVARRLAQHGHSEDEVLAAAYLHDVLEDRPAFEARMRAELPPLVVSIVETLTEQKLDERGAKRPKQDRFEDYVAGLSVLTPITRRAIPISCADKLDNAESLVMAERRGDRLLDRLTTRPDQHGPQLARMRDIYAPVVHASLLTAFDAAVAELLELIAIRTR
jgi:(p)ppGpp synthase/HD superfamily hydrolase